MKKLRLIAIYLLVTSQICFGQNLTFGEIVQTPQLNGCGLGDLELVDVDGDGDLDLFLGGHEEGFAGALSSTIYHNDGTGDFTEDTSILFTILREVDAGFADLDGDGDQDVVLAGRDGSFPLTELYLNDGSGGFTLDPSFGLPNMNGTDFSFGDIDGDSDIDIVFSGNIGTSSPNYIAEVYVNDGSASFTLNATLDSDFLVGGNELVDIDGDGDLDILCIAAELDNSASFLYKNNGAGVFTASLSDFGEYNDSYFVSGDIDQDGDIDAFVSGSDPNGNRIPRLYYNDGTGFFSEVVIDSVFAPLTAGQAALTDLDNDGDLDIFQSGSGTSAIGFLTIVFENHGNQTFLASDTLVSSYITELAIGDITGDNLSDLIYGGRTLGTPENKTWVYRNETTTTPVMTEAILEAEAIGIYPNPTTGIVSVKGMLDNYTIEILDIVGGFHQSFAQSSGPIIEIDLSTLPAGIYFINILHDTSRTVKMTKIIKM